MMNDGLVVSPRFPPNCRATAKEKGGAFPPRPWPPRRRMLLGDVGVMVEKLLQRQSGNPLECDDRNGRCPSHAVGIDADHRVAARSFDGEPCAQVGVGCIHPREYITQIQLIIIPERETVVCPLLFKRFGCEQPRLLRFLREAVG